MVITCAVVGCRSSWNAFNGISFHRITKNKKLLPLWQQVVEINASDNAKICSLHFKPEDFVDGKDEKRLKRDVVPSFNNIDMVTDEDSGDKVNDDKNLSTLKSLLANGSHFVSADTHTTEIEEDEDDKNLSTLKKLLTNYSNSVPSAKFDEEIDLAGGNVKSQPENFVEMAMCCCNSKQRKNVGTQAERKTNRETELQARVKLLGSRLARRDAKISNMKAVFQMIKKLVKGTDMEYKLCCELENIAAFSEANKGIVKKNVSQTQGREESLAFIDNKSDEAESSGDEAGTCIEVAFSPNLRPRHGI